MVSISFKNSEENLEFSFENYNKIFEIDTRSKNCFDAKILCPFETTLIEINSFQRIIPDFVCLEHSKPLYALQSHKI